MSQPNLVVREILDKISLVEVVSDYVQLKKAGNSWKGLCPFHNEKTPSFNVNESKGLYYAFVSLAETQSPLTKLPDYSTRSGQRLAKGWRQPERTEYKLYRAARQRRADMLHAVHVATILPKALCRYARSYLATEA